MPLSRLVLGGGGGILSQDKSLFDGFTQSLEARFTSIDNRFSQVISSAASIVVDDSNISDNVCQDVTILFQLPLQYPSILNLRLTGFSWCCIQATWEPP